MADKENTDHYIGFAMLVGIVFIIAALFITKALAESDPSVRAWIQARLLETQAKPL